MVKAGASTSSEDGDGLSPLHAFAASKQPLKDEAGILAALVDGGADINRKGTNFPSLPSTSILTRDRLDSTPLHLATFHGPAGHSRVKLLLANGARVDNENLRGWSALHQAYYQQDQELIQLLTKVPLSGLPLSGA